MLFLFQLKGKILLAHPFFEACIPYPIGIILNDIATDEIKDITPSADRRGGAPAGRRHRLSLSPAI
jgi:hypothetical protein